MGNIMLPMLEVDINQPLLFGEAALYGLQMLLIGMLIVFAVLALLWLSLEISGNLGYRKAGCCKEARACRCCSCSNRRYRADCRSDRGDRCDGIRPRHPLPRGVLQKKIIEYRYCGE